tara:strand:+ start:86 stop:781 length:696 start_codon:yes stop_codon:yes gene_type:complete
MINLIKINTMFMDHFAGLKVGLQADHVTVFSFICETRDCEGMTLKDLQVAMSTSQAKMHRVTSALQDAGLLKLVRCERDFRHMRAFLSEKGRAFAQEASALLSSDCPDTVAELKGKMAKIVSKVSQEKLMLDKRREISSSGNFSDRRKAITQALKNRGETFVEVGRNYARTKRGIVSSPVLLKRSKASSIGQLIDFIRNESDDDYEKLMTPTPTKRAKGPRMPIRINEIKV